MPTMSLPLVGVTETRYAQIIVIILVAYKQPLHVRYYKNNILSGSIIVLGCELNGWLFCVLHGHKLFTFLLCVKNTTSYSRTSKSHFPFLHQNWNLESNPLSLYVQRILTFHPCGHSFYEPETLKLKEQVIWYTNSILCSFKSRSITSIWKSLVHGISELHLDMLLGHPLLQVENVTGLGPCSAAWQYSLVHRSPIFLILPSNIFFLYCKKWPMIATK